MGLFRKILGMNKDTEEKEQSYSAITTPSTAVASNKIPTPDSIDLSSKIHTDIRDLLWIADGPQKNYTLGEGRKTVELMGGRISYYSIMDEEPSVISLKAPVEFVTDNKSIERPPYWPRYITLTPEQRGVYWNLLQNPYNTEIDIGFVFILYYGLERHLLCGNCDKAFDVILKLRDVHQNGSFQRYSGNALVLISLLRQRVDLIQKFIQSIDHDYELTFDNELFLLCKYGLNLPITAKDIIRLAKTFEFTNLNYIKNYTELFEETMTECMMNKFNSKVIYLSNYISEISSVPKCSVQIFANSSINRTTVEIPNYAKYPKFKDDMFTLLSESHVLVKNKLSQLRKEGTAPKPTVTKQATQKEPLIFDSKLEKAILSDIKAKRDNVIDLHFAYLHTIEFYYKYRSLDDVYLNKCIDYCNEDIAILPKVQEAWHNKTTGKYFIDSVNDSGINNSFNAVIPSFKRLAMIYEQQKQYDKAIDICNDAITYHTKYHEENRIGEISERKERLLSKKLKQ